MYAALERLPTAKMVVDDDLLVRAYGPHQGLVRLKYKMLARAREDHSHNLQALLRHQPLVLVGDHLIPISSSVCACARIVTEPALVL